MKIQHKRSNQKDGQSAKAPSAEFMEYGELAVNFNEDDPAIFIKDSGDQVIRIAGSGSAGAPTIGDGVLTINESDGTLIDTFSANQTGNTTITLPESTSFDGDYNSLTNKPTIGDGVLTINESDGTLIDTFSANQTGNTTITLPAGSTFDGDYNSLTNKPTIGDGTITLNASNGSQVGSFSVNQTGNSTFNLPAGGEGPPGPAATVQVGTTTTGSAGSSASVYNSGSAYNAVFNFTIPRGPGGPPGNVDYNVVIRRDVPYDQTMVGGLICTEEITALYFNGAYNSKFGVSEDAYTVFQGYGEDTSALPAPVSLYASGRGYFKAGVGAYSFNGRDFIIDLERDNDDHYTTRTVIDSEGNEGEEPVYNGPVLSVKERLQNLIARLDSLEADEVADDATSTLLLTTVNNLNADMGKAKDALIAIRTAADAAGTLEQLKADIVTATADI